MARHWHGELSLPQSYWVNGVLLLLPFNIYFRIAGAVAKTDPPHSPLAYLYLFTIPALIALPLQIWAGVGVWRSAGVRFRLGKKGWSVVARIVVIVNVFALIAVGIIATRYTYSAFVGENFEHNASYTVSRHKNYVMFHGPITEAAADKLVSELKRSGVNRLVINGSIGGFIRPALRIAEVVTERHLFVVAVTQCESACTAVLAAGNIRAITPTTATGFHRGLVFGLNETAPDDDQMDNLYRAAGLSERFVAKIRTHRGPRDLYDPPLRELISQGFVTDIYVAAIKGYEEAKAWCEQTPNWCNRTGRANWIKQHGNGS
jgi:hypothetical protein